MNIAILGFFKYEGFVLNSLNAVLPVHITYHPLALPIGISFYTFQILSYIIDVYRGNVKVQKNILNFALYVTMFPQLIAGPIVQYADVEEQLVNRKSSWNKFGEGCMYFIRGLAKKVLLANTSGMIFTEVTGLGKGNVSVLSAWLGAFAYMFQIYFDFSGYSDMAIGLGWMFGFHFKENFNYPYSSTSIREFWRRWHISLSSWFLEYLYIPLGGNRKGKVRTCINKFIVFLCTGIWHGANVTFLFWGIYHGCFLMLEEFVPFFRKEGGKIKTAVMRIYTLLVVCIGFVFFRADTMTQGVQWVKAMFTGFSMGAASTSLALQQLTPLYLVTFTVACIASFPVFEKWKSDGRYQAFYNNMAFVCSIVGLVLCMLSLAGGTYNPFIYFRF